jgi:hypothetical protein
MYFIPETGNPKVSKNYCILSSIERHIKNIGKTTEILPI